MPVQPTYPGVYIEEVPSGVRTITGVSTSVGAFIDYFTKGPMNSPVRILSMGDFEREFGGLNSNSEASYAIQQFFLNGGTEAWIVRVASGSPSVAKVDILTATSGGSTALTVSSVNEGEWGNNLRVDIDYPTPNSNNRFNMTISLLETRNGESIVVQTETFLNLSMDENDLRFVKTVVNDESSLVRVAANGTTRPAETGTVSGLLTSSLSLTSADPQMTVTIGGETGIAKLSDLSGTFTLKTARRQLESAIRSAKPDSPAFSQARISIVDNQLRIHSREAKADLHITFSSAGTDPTAANLGLLTGITLDGVLTSDISANFSPTISGGDIDITIGGATHTLTLPVMADLATARNELESQIRAADTSNAAFSHARVSTDTDGSAEHLIVLAGVPGSSVSFSPATGDTTATEMGLDTAGSITAFLSDHIEIITTINATSQVDVTAGGEGPHTATIGANADSLSLYASELESAIQAATSHSAFDTARVIAYDEYSENRLIAIAGNVTATIIFSPTNTDTTTVTELKLDSATASANVQQYSLGVAGPIPNTAQGAGQIGVSGTPPNASALIGNLSSKTGIYALEDVDLFNILCIPRTAMVSGTNALSGTEAAQMMQVAIAYCEKRRAFFVMDTPSNCDEVDEILEWLDDNATLRHKNSALYFPRVKIPDPLNNFRLRSVGASGTMAGLYARTDGQRGVWKAPAGIDTALRGVQDYDYVLSDDENGVLNPLAINCARNFPIYGNVAWGARTLVGSNERGSEWKYVPVRRIALFLEESLYRGTKWVVFEPNDEPLWSQIRLNIGAFMHNLFRQGAFQGSTPRDAYFVKCDSETTPQNDINLGIVNIHVGFAPLKPAEFVIIKIQQIAGQIET